MGIPKTPTILPDGRYDPESLAGFLSQCRGSGITNQEMSSILRVPLDRVIYLMGDGYRMIMPNASHPNHRKGRGVIHPLSFVAESVYALRDFKDRDGVSIRKGQHLGELHRGGYVYGRQWWWTQKDGQVTATFSGDSSNYVTSTQ